MSLDKIKQKVSEDKSVDFRESGFERDFQKGDKIEVQFYDLDWDTETEKFELPQGNAYKTMKMRIDKFSCESYNNYGTNLISETGTSITSKKTFVCSDGSVSIGEYVEGVWFNINKI